MHSSKPPIVVVGAGIIGLTTAIRLLQSPSFTSPVYILASHFPSNPLHPAYASTAAGAHHLSFADDEDERQIRWDTRTFDVMSGELEHEGEDATGLMRLKQTEYYDGEEKHLKILERHPEFKIHLPDTLPYFATHSVSFSSLTMTPTTYLLRLTRLFISLGGHLHQHHLSSLSSLSSLDFLPSPPSAVVLCIGLGARSLIGLEDEKPVYPVRGQVVVLEAPWIKTGWTRQEGSLSGGEGGQRTYVIPRGNGEVVIGGTRDADDSMEIPREETTTSILRRALVICPELLPPLHQKSPSITSLPSFPSEDDVSFLRGLIRNVVVGFRPAREDGARLERLQDVGRTKMYTNYGHGGAGWQSCWGCAEDVVGLVEADL